MSKLIEIGDHNRAVEFDIREPLYQYVFRREGSAWVKERRAGSWELYEATLQYAIKEWRPCRQRITPDELERLLVLFMKVRPPETLDEEIAGPVVEALRELQERRGTDDRLKLIDIKESNAVVSEITIEVAKILDIPLWLTAAQPFTPYDRLSDQERSERRFTTDSRRDDSTNGRNATQRLSLHRSPYGTMMLSIDGCPSVFFDSYESTQSPYVYRALNVLAEAIRRDNEDRPQTQGQGT